MNTNKIVQLLIAAVIMVAVPLQSNAAWTDAQISVVVDQHNFYRAQVTPTAANMVKVTWNTTLANLAQQWADTCPSGHPSPTDPTYAGIGQNMFITSASASALNFTTAVAAWYNEVNSYTFSTNGCSSTCGHYTQVVWANTSTIGCGSASCSGTTKVFCNYYRPGNYVGQKPYVSGTVCSQCPAGFEKCVNGLCSSAVRTILTHTRLTALFVALFVMVYLQVIV